MIHAPTCRWSLRTMFVAMTVVCCWLSWLCYELNWIRERRAYIAGELANRKRQVPARSHAVMSVGTTIAEIDAPPPAAPSMLWAFGEGGVSTVFVGAEAVSVQQLTDNDWRRVRQARRLFPEATVKTVHGWQDGREMDAKSDIPPD